jgi:hypothetical protein
MTSHAVNSPLAAGSHRAIRVRAARGPSQAQLVAGAHSAWLAVRFRLLLAPAGLGQQMASSRLGQPTAG